MVPTIVWAGPITDLVLGDEFAESADVMRALAPLTFLFGIAPIVSVAVNYLGEARRRIPIAIAALVANFVVSIVLLYEIGVVGSAIGADVAYLIYVPGALLDLQAPDRPAGAPGGGHVRAHARCARARWRSRCWPSATTSCRCWTGLRAAPPASSPTVSPCC